MPKRKNRSVQGQRSSASRQGMTAAVALQTRLFRFSTLPTKQTQPAERLLLFQLRGRQFERLAAPGNLRQVSSQSQAVQLPARELLGRLPAGQVAHTHLVSQ